jgi:hypothetical protein
MSLFTGGIATALGLAATIGGQTIGASKQASAAEHGADLQAKAAAEALAFAKDQKAKQETAFAPYQSISQQALQNPLAARPVPGGPPMPFTTQPRATMPAQPQGAPLSMMGQSGPQMTPQVQPVQSLGAPAASPDAMVMLQAPDGSQKRVPAAQADAYIARGAKRVG